MDYLQELEDVINVRLERRVLRDNMNPMEKLNDIQFFQNFRFSKNSALEIFRSVEDMLKVQTNRGLPVPPLLQFLGTLRFYATGSFQSVIGDLFKVSQPAMSRIIKRVSTAIASRHHEVIKFPDRDSLFSEKQKFMDIGGIPGVIGAIDCT
ncbi:MAG: hypothetical protein AB2693_28800, partial [Candidatus Thiodiazotropha sp.]